MSYVACSTGGLASLSVGGLAGWSVRGSAAWEVEASASAPRAEGPLHFLGSRSDKANQTQLGL